MTTVAPTTDEFRIKIIDENKFSRNFRRCLEIEVQLRAVLALSCT